MTEEQRKERISNIMNLVRGTNYETDINIPIALWVNIEEDQFNAQWMDICENMVKWSEVVTGKKDNNSLFAQYLREHKARKNKKQDNEQSI